MTTERGWVEPVDASELTAQHDDLEHWLQGIRTDLADNPPDWLDDAAAASAATTGGAATGGAITGGDFGDSDFGDGDFGDGDFGDGDFRDGNFRDGNASDDEVALPQPDAQVTSDDRVISAQPISAPSEVQHVGRHRAED